MASYAAPGRDMNFVLTELADLSEVNNLPGYGEATPDLVKAVIDEASRFASEVLAPLNKPGDENGAKINNNTVIAPDGFAGAYQAFVAGGWSGLPFATEKGGQGLPELVSTAVNEIWQSANMAFALCPMLTEGAVVALDIHASEEIKETYLPAMISGEWTGTMNLTEPQAGSDLAAVKTRAKPNGDHYLISGQKIFITWGDQDFSNNIIHLVLARLPDAPPGIKGISLFLVPKYILNPDGSIGKRNDVYPVSIEHKLGIHASPTCVMSYGDNGGAVGYLVGEENNGVACMFTMMNHARIAVGIQGLSISERAYQQALSYARERVQGHVPGQKGKTTIIQHPDVRRMLMLMKSGTEAMRALSYVTAASLDFIHHAEDEAVKTAHRERFALLTPVVKAWCTELGQELTSIGVQIHGGMGYIEETGAAQHFRDARITTIYEGTTGIQAQDLVGRKILRDSGKALTELMREMREIADLLRTYDDVNFNIIYQHYSAGINALEQAAAWLLDTYQSDIHLPGSVACNMLMLMGVVCGGWQMARAALIARQKLDNGTPANDFYEAKIITARFFAEHILSRANAYLPAVLAGSESILAIKDEMF